MKEIKCPKCGNKMNKSVAPNYYHCTNSNCTNSKIEVHKCIIEKCYQARLKRVLSKFSEKKSRYP